MFEDFIPWALGTAGVAVVGVGVEGILPFVIHLLEGAGVTTHLPLGISPLCGVPPVLKGFFQAIASASFS